MSKPVLIEVQPRGVRERSASPAVPTARRATPERKMTPVLTPTQDNIIEPTPTVHERPKSSVISLESARKDGVEKPETKKEAGDRPQSVVIPLDGRDSRSILEREPDATPVMPKSLERVRDDEIAAKLRGENSIEEEPQLPEGHIECPFKLFGCAFNGPIVNVQKHIRDDKFLHLSQMCDNVLTLQREVQQEIEKSSKYLALDDELIRRTTANDKLFSCQLIWRIDDYSSHFKLARDGKKALLLSRPFFSHCNGYKLVCMLAPYGDGEALREHASVFISIVRGDNDGMLAWPFRCPVTFTLIHQQGGENVTATLEPKPLPANEPFLGRPTADRNPAFGLQRFARLDDMRNGRGIVVHDKCFLKIDVDIHDVTAF